jgi:hypothetical protein
MLFTGHEVDGCEGCDKSFDQCNCELNADDIARRGKMSRPITAADDLKQFTMRMPKQTWLFLKSTCASQGISMGSLIINCVDKYKSKLDKIEKNKEINN